MLREDDDDDVKCMQTQSREWVHRKEGLAWSAPATWAPPPHLPTHPPPAPAGAGTGEEEEEGESVHYLPRRWKEPGSPCQELALAKNTGKQGALYAEEQ